MLRRTVKAVSVYLIVLLACPSVRADVRPYGYTISQQNPAPPDSFTPDIERGMRIPPLDYLASFLAFRPKILKKAIVKEE